MRPGPPAPWSELRRPTFGFLFGGSLFARVLSFARSWGTGTGDTQTDERQAVADFIVGLLLSEY